MEGHDEYKSLRTRRELATTPAWVLSRGFEMAKTENRNQQKERKDGENRETRNHGKTNTQTTNRKQHRAETHIYFEARGGSCLP